uniref:Uncharacterized protein n=1 Tax=Arundo donax TaxID=35708 RepID=A0A0A8ZNX7_ARUDO
MQVKALYPGMAAPPMSPMSTSHFHARDKVALDQVPPASYMLQCLSAATNVKIGCTQCTVRRKSVM